MKKSARATAKEEGFLYLRKTRNYISGALV